MSHAFDPGSDRPEIHSLFEQYPDADVYPLDDFRTEWGPIFYRGRLDGSARIVVIGQDPAAHESIARRILVGEAGQRVQGFLARLGLTRSYVMINTFLYSVYGQGGGARHDDDPHIAEYRNKWLDALITDNVEGVIAFGQLADKAFTQWVQTPNGKSFGDLAYATARHPTYPVSASASGQKTKAEATADMLRTWNAALQILHPALKHPDKKTPLSLYGDTLEDADDVEIPEFDLPAGTPPWMRSLKAWATRTGEDANEKRARIQVTIPRDFRTWPAID
jgi:uracil-DNA glycosylase